MLGIADEELAVAGETGVETDSVDRGVAVIVEGTLHADAKPGKTFGLTVVQPADHDPRLKWFGACGKLVC